MSLTSICMPPSIKKKKARKKNFAVTLRKTKMKPRMTLVRCGYKNSAHSGSAWHLRAF